MSSMLQVDPNFGEKREYALLSTRGVILSVFFLVLLLSAFYEGFRMPNLWSINYYQASIQDGFFRRSLAGTLLWFFGDLRFNYHFIAAIQFTVLAGLFWVLYKAYMRNALCCIVVALYIASPAGGYLFHQVGYIDQLLYLTLLAAMMLYKKYPQHAIALVTLSLMFHEEALFVVVPIFAVYVLVTTHSMREGIIATVPSVVLFLAISLFGQTASDEKIKLFLDRMAYATNYPYRGDYYDTFRNTFLGDRFRLYFNYHHTFMIGAATLLASATGYIAGVIYQQKYKKRKLSPLLVMAAVFLAGISPLVLGAFGWDVDRWIILAITSTTALLLYFFYDYRGKIAIWKIIPVVMVYTLLVAYMPITYFDGYEPRSGYVPGIIHFYTKDLTHLLSEIPRQ